jgi:hypothetical protein
MFILKAWVDNLNGRSVEEKMSRKGRESSAIQSQTVAYMKPLFRNLKHKVSLMRTNSCSESCSQMHHDFSLTQSNYNGCLLDYSIYIFFLMVIH